ncbi:hypothetical protein MSC49_00540 [Methylosinus sp. C49]|uniref:hypothetical protein n=1 Tax=Methylosinus sp. C49 TaxID=2699395 RepID=UPI00136794BE|nr:hypothetical protein [Methylosinus sp. C49]BBU60119.1 hypothetical protein MSC49_00540 [Methylosinus sp. C49]
MYLSPTFFLDLGLRTIARNPFFSRDRPVLVEGESDFRLLEGQEGLVVTLGPNTAFFDRPNRSVCRWPGVKTIPRQSPHEIPPRSFFANEGSAFLQIFCGGGDVRLNRVTTLAEQRQILLSAGDGNVVEKIDLSELARDGAPPLKFLQPAYLCSSAEVAIRSTPCDAATMSWARAPYVYRAEETDDAERQAILCLSGRTMVWCERLAPGESRDFALGNVIAATENIDSKLRPTSLRHPDDAEASDEETPIAVAPKPVRTRLREFVEATGILFESMRAREGFLVCELTNRSDRPAYVYVQLNKTGFYGGSGFVGLMVKLVSAFLRMSHLPLRA